ncbi:MAG: transposase [Candidatus Saccharimonadales bacterium]
MSPKDIVAGVSQLTQTKLMPTVPKKWSPQFHFGLQAYGLKAFQSATSNARQVVVNANTAARKSERLLANSKLADHFGEVFDALGLIKPASFVNIDHSDMNRLVALVGAVQTRKGRAVPCLVETTYSDHLPAQGSARSTPRTNALRQMRAKERRTTSFTGHYIDALQTFAERLGFWPKLVFDRGFGNESLVTHLTAEGCTFYIRLKGGRFVHLDGQRIATKALAQTDATAELFGLTLRIVRSPKNRRAKEPWYILTNDQNSSRDKVVRIYYHRFEIEETFRDMKHIWELKRTRLNKPNSLKVIMWLVSIGIGLLYLVAKPTKHVGCFHSKKQISWLRQAYEQLQQATNLLLWGQG